MVSPEDDLTRSCPSGWHACQLPKQASGAPRWPLSLSARPFMSSLNKTLRFQERMVRPHGTRRLLREVTIEIAMRQTAHKFHLFPFNNNSYPVIADTDAIKVNSSAHLLEVANTCKTAAASTSAITSCTRCRMSVSLIFFRFLVKLLRKVVFTTCHAKCRTLRRDSTFWTFGLRELLQPVRSLRVLQQTLRVTDRAALEAFRQLPPLRLALKQDQLNWYSPQFTFMPKQVERFLLTIYAAA